MITTQQRIYQAAAPDPQASIMFPTLGVVVDTNDPTESGRVRVICAKWGDSWNTPVEDLPWAIYMSAYAGQVEVGTRGPGVQTSEGGVSYGLWAIPKVGAQVAVVCLDGNPMNRMYIGSVPTAMTAHTMPHGRFMYDDHPELEKPDNVVPYGPFTSTENLIQPLATNLKRAFGTSEQTNHEYRTRGADYSVASVDVSQLSSTFSRVPDDQNVDVDGLQVTQGYQVSRIDPHAVTSVTDKNYDSSVVSLTSPGFHSVSMDDRQENCRMRLRTTSGHQVILDDTNERIYISTATGNNWVEMDQNGNIDIYSGNKVSIHAAKEMNLTSDETVRIYGKKGVHIKSDQQVVATGSTGVHLSLDEDKFINLSSTGVNIGAADTLSLAAKSVNIKASSGALVMESLGDASIKAGAAVTLGAGANVNITAAAQFLTKGAAFYWNGAAPAAPATATIPDLASNQIKLAMWTNRVPQHEPFARTMTKDDYSHEAEFPYGDARVNREERGRKFERGAFWRR